MKFLLIYGVLFLLLWTKGSAIDREESLTDYTAEEEIVNEPVLVEVSSSDFKKQPHSVFSDSKGFESGYSNRFIGRERSKLEYFIL